MQRDNETQIRNLTKKAEDAIKHFKDIAISRIGTKNVAEFSLKGKSDNQKP